MLVYTLREEWSPMRRTRIKMMAAVMAATMLLGGCGDALYDLTDDEENVIVNYAAHIVTKYNTYQREGLTYVSPEEPEETQEDVTVPQTPETQDASETGTAASAEAAAPAVSVAAAGSASLDQLFGADGIQMTYAGAQLAPGYMEGDYYEMTPDAGKQYLVLSIDVTNTGADGVGLDVYEEENDKVYEDLSGTILQSSTMARLLSFPNVMVTSHQGFFTREALEAISRITLENAAAFEKGETLVNEVTK